MSKTMESSSRRFDSIRPMCTAALLLAVALQFAVAQNSPKATSMASLHAGFQSPPPQARLRCYWWWLNGHTDKATITHDLEEMAAKGIGGALLVDADGASQEGNAPVPKGPTFGSPAWIELYTHALREADRLGLEITLNITSGWNLGGPDVTPEQSSKLLTWSRTRVHGGAPATVQLASPPEKNGFYRQIAVLAYPLHNGAELHPLPGLRERSASVETGFSMPSSDWMLTPNGHPKRSGGLARPTRNDLRQGYAKTPLHRAESPLIADAALDEVKDVTQFVSQNGKLKWSAPDGEWEILRIGYTDSDARVSTASGAWQGRAIDYLSKPAFDAYWDHTVEPLLLAAKPFHSLKYLAEDSLELGGTNWTDEFAAEFRTRRGYDPVAWLPVVTGRVLTSPDASARFLTDLRRTVADLITENHYCEFQRRAAPHGLGMQAESGGPHGVPIDGLESFRCSPMPQTEFWAVNTHRDGDEQRFFVKEAASASNIYGHPLALAEGETSVGPQWSESLATDLKPTFDMAVTEGLNGLVWHEFTSSPASQRLPGQEYFAGTHLNPNVTWWQQSPAFFGYLNRVQFLMQQGTPVDDLLYFYGDNVPAFARLKADDPAKVLPGFDYDVTDEDALLHQLRITRDGMLESASGVRWRALALPVQRRLSLAALKFVRRYLDAGGTVIGLRPTGPSGLVSGSTSSEWQRLATDIWGTDCADGARLQRGAGQVLCMASARDGLLKMGVLPDVEISPAPAAGSLAVSDADFDYVHRKDGQRDIYFIRNGSAHVSEHQVVFRARATHVEFWDPVDGSVSDAHSTRTADGRSRLDLALSPFASTFVVFSPDGTTGASPEMHVADIAPLETTWQVSFQKGRGAPDRPLAVHDLKSWTEWPQPGVRYFAGTATYRAKVDS
ncbi:MAG TPA: glycosyl hydrolase, partial [Acidobacteriaceae bacterium]|nr:glycosyl hydrolase [Acidobacteriaceae bacterium]